VIYLPIYLFPIRENSSQHIYVAHSQNHLHEIHEYIHNLYIILSDCEIWWKPNNEIRSEFLKL
jgi:hypothetical protein